MTVDLNSDESMDIKVCGKHIGFISSESTVFMFDDGWIKIEGKTVTFCPYVNGGKGKEVQIHLADFATREPK